MLDFIILGIDLALSRSLFMIMTLINTCTALFVIPCPSAR